MATKTSITIKSIDTNNNPIDETYNFINTELSDSDADTWARMMNGVTTNTYVDAIRTDTKSLNEALAELGG